MATAAGAEFNKIFNWDGVGTASGDYTNVTLEAQSPAGTSFTLFNSSAYYLYLGHTSKFDMAIFDIDTAGSLGALTWEYSNGSNWTEFVPASARYEIDTDDNEGGPYDFTKDGAEIFPSNLLDDWATLTINSSNIYWIRVTAASVDSSPTIKRIQMRPYAAYCTSKDVYNLLQFKNVLNGTDFTASTVPSKDTVEQYIGEAQSRIDMYSRKSWRPNYIMNEYQQFSLGGIKLDRPDPYKILSLKIWNGGSWETKTEGRTGDYFLVPDTGLIHFSRYFLLPARFSSINSSMGAWGGGEFIMAVKITYLAGRDIATDVKQGGLVSDITKKLAAMDVMRSADFGGAVVSGMDRVSIESRLSAWEAETSDNIGSLQAFEVF